MVDRLTPPLTPNPTSCAAATPGVIAIAAQASRTKRVTVFFTGQMLLSHDGGSRRLMEC